MRRILLATDGSDHSERAAQLAGALSAALDVPVDVINVVSDGALATAGPIQDYARIERVAITQRELLQSLGRTSSPVQRPQCARPAGSWARLRY